MKRLSLLVISLIVVTGCSSQKTADSPSGSHSGQPIEIKAGKDSWIDLGGYQKIRFANLEAWKYKGMAVVRFFIPSKFSNQANIFAGATTMTRSVQHETIGMPYIYYRCADKSWGLDRGKTMHEFQKTRDAKTLKTVMKVDGKFTGVLVRNKAPWPTTGYDPTKGWDKGFVGKSGHGFAQLDNNLPKFAALIANSKEAEFVTGDKDKKIYFKFSFQTEPAKLVDDLCEFAIDGKVILPADGKSQ